MLDDELDDFDDFEDIEIEQPVKYTSKYSDMLLGDYKANLYKKFNDICYNEYTSNQSRINYEDMYPELNGE